ncbi:MAG: Fic family protein [bacterium]
MKRGATGHYKTTVAGGERVRAFVPNPLPPRPAVNLDGALQQRLVAAATALGRLDGIASMLPNEAIFLYSYVRKEAVLSSQIEGTQSSLSDLLLSELDVAPGVPMDDVAEVSNYVAALEHGMARLRGGFPLCTRLIREIHEVLLSSGRGSDKNPGEFRRAQNWVGGTAPGNARFIPPPHREVPDGMAALEKFLHDPTEPMPALLRAGLAHVQFETIHPFLDGNGRVGRMLITLLLCTSGVLREPLLYLSLYFKQHRETYYQLLNHVRQTGDWEAWLAFFLRGVREISDNAFETATELDRLFQQDREKISQQAGRRASSALRIHEALMTRPLLTLPQAHKKAAVTHRTASKAMEALVQLDIAREVTNRHRNRVFAYRKYLDILIEGT